MRHSHLVTIELATNIGTNGAIPAAAMVKKMKHYFEVYLAYNNCHSCWFDVILLNHWQYITRHRGNYSVYLIWFVTYSIWHVLIKSISGRLIPLSCLKSYWSILIMDLHFISLLGLNLLQVVEIHHQGRQTPAESKNQYHELWILVLAMREALFHRQIISRYIAENTFSGMCPFDENACTPTHTRTYKKSAHVRMSDLQISLDFITGRVPCDMPHRVQNVIKPWSTVIKLFLCDMLTVVLFIYPSS